MRLIVQIIGILIITEGILFALKPEFLCRVIEFFKRVRWIYIRGTLRIVLAVVFLIGGSQCKIPLVIIVAGILFLISGIAIFMLRLERQKAILNWWQQKSPLVLRLAAIIVLFVGGLIVYSA